MKHELIDLGNGMVYVLNIPTLASEGEMSKEDMVIFNLWNRLKIANNALGKVAHVEIGNSGTTEIALSVKYLNEYKKDEEE